MIIRRTPEPSLRIVGSEICPESRYLQRRQLLKAAGFALLGASSVASGKNPSAPLPSVQRSGRFDARDELTTWEDATTYNNFYEFGTDKADPAKNAINFKPKPWTVEIAGACELPGKYNYQDLVKPHALEERIYRHRCVEAWSMVMPWVGIPLAALLARFKPTSKAKFVAFTTLADVNRMPGLRDYVLDWPYREGLRIDEAMHPLALMAVGLYGRELPNQNGAPMRLVLPWKYGFKGIKSIVKIEFVERQPYTSWSASNSSEYGFYANVNPAVDHPRWSQKTERRLAGSGFSLFKTKRIETLPFNGYAEQVAGLYKGMDLAKNF